jgi:hypothetical protein
MAEAYPKVARSYKHTSLLHAVVQITVVKSFMVNCTGVFVQVVHFVQNKRHDIQQNGAQRNDIPHNNK